MEVRNHELYVPIMVGLLNVTGTGNGHLERVDVEALLVSVGEQADKVMLL